MTTSAARCGPVQVTTNIAMHCHWFLFIKLLVQNAKDIECESHMKASISLRQTELSL